jgi:2-oxoglutarate dehydrogenase E1 component
MGPWGFAKDRLYERFEDSHRITRVSRYESGSPATGSHTVHVQEQNQLLHRALGL